MFLFYNNCLMRLYVIITKNNSAKNMTVVGVSSLYQYLYQLESIKLVCVRDWVGSSCWQIGAVSCFTNASRFEGRLVKVSIFGNYLFSYFGIRLVCVPDYSKLAGNCKEKHISLPVIGVGMGS